MKNPCGMTRAKVMEQKVVNRTTVYFGTGVNPVNSPAQFFVAWGNSVLKQGMIPTFNFDSAEEGHLWFINEEEAEEKYATVFGKKA